ncbi:MAG: hypothetical protein ACKOCJ_05330 [Burkholderiaceae bacterium]
MGILIELGVFALVLGFAIWQWRDLRLAREARERAQAAQSAQAAQAPTAAPTPPPPPPQMHDAPADDRPHNAQRPSPPGGST